MSLQIAAQHLASKGRGPDTMLVHMAPGEVKSLQTLARAHGGTLTTNPDTGLPEAGFLSAILPIVAGAALGPAGLGLTAMQAGLATAALGTVATGSLKKGLMAGLGAYGGAGLMGSVTGAGASAASNMASAEAAAAGDLAAQQSIVPSGIPAAPIAPVAPPVVTPSVSPPPAYLEGAVDPFGGFPSSRVSIPATGATTVDPYGGFGGASAAPADANTFGETVSRRVVPATVEASTYIEKAQPMLTREGVPIGYTYKGATLPVDAVDPSTLLPRSAAPVTPAAPATPVRGAPTYEQMRAAGFTNEQIGQSAREYASNMKGTAQDPFSQATREAMASPVSTGIKAIADKPELLFNKGNLKYGAAALAPLMMQEQKQAAYDGGGPNPYQYSYDPGAQSYGPSSSSAEQKYFNPRYTRMAEGGSTSETNPYSYVYDPVTRTYKSASAAAARPAPTATRTSREYYDPSLGGDAPIPGNIGFAYDPQTGLPNAVTTALVPIANALNIYSPVQGLITGGLPGAILGNAAQQAQNTNISQIAESNSNAGLTPGLASLSMPQGSYAEGQVDVNPGGIGGIGIGGLEGIGVDVGGPIASGDATGVDIGGIGDAIAGGISGADVGGIGDAVGDGGGDGGSDGGDGGDYARGGLSAAMPAYARGGYNLGDYSDGGRLLRGPGDGVSDSIPASIGNKRPARLADGEFVVPARIVSELGNGSTEAGARKLYAMMNRIQNARKKSVGKGKVAVNSRAEKLLPA